MLKNELLFNYSYIKRLLSVATKVAGADGGSQGQIRAGDHRARKQA